VEEIDFATVFHNYENIYEHFDELMVGCPTRRFQKEETLNN
jgi:hypothetical protein